MRVFVYSVFDVKAAAFNQPFFQHSDGSAARLFSDAVNDPNSFISKHPADFSLYVVGVFDDACGLVESISPARHVCNAAEFMPVSPPAALDVARMLPLNGSRVVSPAEV